MSEDYSTEHVVATPSVFEHQVEVNCEASIFLEDWAIRNNLSHTALSELQKWMKTSPSLTNLPADDRTLLKTRRSVDIEVMGAGHFFYFGLKGTI